MRIFFVLYTLSFCSSAALARAPGEMSQVPADGAKVESATAKVDVTTKPAEKDARIGLSFAPKIGLLLPTSALSATYLLGLEIGYSIAPLKDVLGVELGASVELTYGQPNTSGTASGPSGLSGNYSLDQRMMTVALNGYVALPVWKLRGYGGLGYGIYLLKASMDSFGATTTESQTRSGLQVFGGAGYPVWMGEVFGELRYHYVGLAFVGTGDSNAGGFSALAGYRFML